MEIKKLESLDVKKLLSDVSEEIALSSDIVNKSQDLLRISTSFVPENKFKVIDEKRLEKIKDSIPEIVDKSFSFGKSNTQFTTLSMTLDMIDYTPMRKIRQIFAQIENKRSAIRENILNVQRRYIRLKQLRSQFEKETDPLKQEKLQFLITELLIKISDGLEYYEAAIKELGMLIDAYHDIKTYYNIPDDWDEEDVENAEIEEHIKKAFRNLLRDLRMTGKPGMGTQEYLEQLGINPSSAIALAKQYLSKEQEIIDLYLDNKSDILPTYANMRQFLDNVYNIFKDEPKRKLASMGLKIKYTDWLNHK